MHRGRAAVRGRGSPEFIGFWMGFKPGGATALTPLTISICAVGAYSVNSRMIGIWYMLISGMIGYAFTKLDYPLAPVLALVLGDLAQNALRQSLAMPQGSLLILLARSISGVITAVALLFFGLPGITPWWRRLRGVPVPAASPRET